MAVSRINSTTGTNSLTFVSPVAGYIQIVFAFRDGSNTAPTVPTPPTGNAWTTIGSASGANTCSSVAVWRYVASTSDTGSGTFTNATSIIGVQYSGVHASSAIGDNSDTGASSNSVNFNALSAMVDTSGSSWAVGFVGHRATDGTITTAPSGMTNVTSVSDATDQAAIHDTNAGVTSWSTTSASLGGTSSGYRARVVEVRAAGSTTLTAGVGSYTITGTAATLKIGRKIVGDVGSYAITGTDATLKYGRKLTADVGSYVITGTAAALKVATKLTAAVGSYVISGVDAVLAYGRKIAADVGSYVISGTDASFRVGRKLTGAVGSYTLTGTDATLTWTPASGGWAVAINFRDSSGYATDAADETYCLGEGDTYPTTRNSMTFGWVSINADAGRDRDNTLDRRLAGMNQQSNAGGTQAEFKIDLPSSGECDITLAIGDGTSDQAYQRIDVYDDTNLLFSIVDAGGTLAAHFDDATGVDRTAAAWPGSNVAQSVTFTTTTCILKLGATSAQANSSTIAHIRIEHAGGTNTTLSADVGSYTITGTDATLTYTAATPVVNLQPGNYAEVFRPRLKKKKRKEIERAVEIVTAKPPSAEQLTKLAEELVDTASPAEIQQLANSLMSQLDKLAAEMRLAFQIEKEREEREAAARKALILAALAAWEKQMEEDEMLLAYII